MSAREGGGFRVRDDPPDSRFRIAIEVAYTDAAPVEAIRTRLTEAYATAFAELDRRFAGPNTTSGHRPAGEHRR